MNKTEFKERCFKIIYKAVMFSEKSQREGIIALEDDIEDLHEDTFSLRDIFRVGMHLVLIGTDRGIIEKVLSNLVNQEKDKKICLLKTMQKEAVLLIQEGANTISVAAVLLSYIDDSLAREIEKRIILGDIKEDGEQLNDDLWD